MRYRRIQPQLADRLIPWRTIMYFSRGSVNTQLSDISDRLNYHNAGKTPPQRLVLTRTFNCTRLHQDTKGGFNRTAQLHPMAKQQGAALGRNGFSDRGL